MPSPHAASLEASDFRHPRAGAEEVEGQGVESEGDGQ